MKFLASKLSIVLVAVSLCLIGTTNVQAEHHEQIIQLNKFVIANKDQHSMVDGYLKNAYLPSLKRAGIKNVGVFEAHNKEKDGLHIWVLVPFDNFEQYAALGAHLVEDTQFHDDGAEYLFLQTKKDRAYERIEGTLMQAFSGWPKVTKAGQGDKLYELRDYESFSEYKGFMKVNMFNNGEIDIFNKTGLDGIFYGRVLAGKNAPNLVYMVSYKDMEERDANWKKFLNHPDWKSLSKEEQYKQTVSKIHQTFLVAKPYSQL